MSGMVKTVLLADPHSLVRRGVRCLLESTGKYTIVASVGDRTEAMRATVELQPDIVLVDPSVTDTNVDRVIAEIKNDAPRTKVVFYTHLASELWCKNAVQCGADAIVFKSDTEDQLLLALSAVAVGRSFYSSQIPEPVFARRRGNCLVSPREQEVVTLIASGMNNRSIAQSLGISFKTVETHRAKANEKLNCRTTADLVRYALRNELVAA